MSTQAIHPIGDSRAGGAADPRVGTATSIFDPDYHIRNIVYLASVNRCYALDPTSVAFPHDVVAQNEPADGHFHTITASAFGRYVADLNYFHPRCPIEQDSIHLDSAPDGVWVAVKTSIYGGDTPLLTSAAATSAASQLLAKVFLELACESRAQQVLRKAPSALLPVEAYPVAVRLADGSAHRAALLVNTVTTALRLGVGVGRVGGHGAVTEHVPTAVVRVAEAARLLGLAHGAFDVLGPAADALPTARLLVASNGDPALLHSMCRSVRRSLCARAAVEGSVRFDRLLRQASLLPLSHAASPHPSASAVGGMWVVLVGGETASIRYADQGGKRPGAWFGGHSSLQSIGRAYEMLVPIFGRDRIIVIAQVRETLEWLEAATASADACLALCGSPKYLPMLQLKLADTRRDCACLLADGGADYDHTDVNPATIVRVITGRPHGDVQRVVPKGAQACGASMLLMFSHGTAHPRRPPPLDDDEGDEEHYMQMPHPVPDGDRKIYADIPWRGDDKVFSFEEVAARQALRVLAATNQTVLSALVASGATMGDMSYEGAVFDIDLKAMTATHRVRQEVRRLELFDGLWRW